MNEENNMALPKEVAKKGRKNSKGNVSRWKFL